MWIRMLEQFPLIDHEVLFYLPKYKAACRGSLCIRDIHDGSCQLVSTLCLEIFFSSPWGNGELQTYNKDLTIASLWTEIPKITKNKLRDELKKPLTRFELMDIE